MPFYSIELLVIIEYLDNIVKKDSLAEWSKAPDLGSGPKGRGFKSHSCQNYFSFFFWALN